MNEPLPAALQPTAADIARDAELAAQSQAILKELEATGAGRVKVNTESYNAVSYGADGQVISRVRNGVALQTPAQEAVARAQSAANAEIKDMERNLQHLTDRYDEISGYDPEGKPLYVRGDNERAQLEKQIRQLRLGIVNQKRLNERRWRNEAAPAIRRIEEDNIRAEDLAKELMAKGRVQRIPGW